MAIYLPQQRPTDFSPTSPPDRAMYYPIAAAPQATGPADMNDHRMQHRLSSDLPRMGGAGPTTNGALPMPNAGPQPHMANGGSRHRSTMSLGAFEGPRSPPNTKSKNIITSHHIVKAAY